MGVVGVIAARKPENPSYFVLAESYHKFSARVAKGIAFGYPKFISPAGLTGRLAFGIIFSLTDRSVSIGEENFCETDRLLP
jgi:hypothetical protein